MPKGQAILQALISDDPNYLQYPLSTRLNILSNFEMIDMEGNITFEMDIPHMQETYDYMTYEVLNNRKSRSQKGQRHIKKYGNLAMCRPCSACMLLIRKAGIRTVYYTDKDGFNKLELV